MPFWQKLITFKHTNFNICTKSKYFLCDTNQYNIYLYATGTILCQHIFLFCATRNIFSFSESLSLEHLFWVNIFFLLLQHIFCDTHNFRVQRNFYVKDFFVDTTYFFVFCATRTKCEHTECGV